MILKNIIARHGRKLVMGGLVWGVGAISTGEYNPIKQVYALARSVEGSVALKQSKDCLVENIDTNRDFSISEKELETFEKRTGLELGIELSAPLNTLYDLPIEKIREANRAYAESKQ